MTRPSLITTQAELDHALESSRDRPVMIFKHSLACGASAAIREVYRDFLAGRSAEDGVLYAMIEIQNAREVSSAVAERTGVRHASPQVLLLKGGRVVWKASHWSISKESLDGALASVATVTIRPLDPGTRVDPKVRRIFGGH
jgi:bacillithiol system protein YtxJ